ncbi:MAG TPA: anthranilate synthase component I [Acidobacteriaceae bacterium]|jgi:anthranilate synthase component 1|nr:anthranilate synthase component I [Acidobacteriaceae bacterium]
MPASRSTTSPSLADFTALAKQHTLIPVTRSVAADLETPVSAFLRVAAHEPEAFLLESVEGGETVGRYTFIGIRPYKTLSAHNGHITVTAPGAAPHTYPGDIFAELKSALAGHTPARLPNLPPFTAGAVGFFSYDVVRQIEHLPTLAPDELHVPDAHLMFFDEVLAFDHVRKAIHLIVTAGARTLLTPRTHKEAYAEANHRLDRLESLLEAALVKPTHDPIAAPLALTPRTQPEAFLRAVSTVKEYIRAGDVFQCVLSQRFDCTPAVDPFAIYRSLRIVNPSPYMYFLRFNLPEGTEQGTGPPGGPLIARPHRAMSGERLCHIVGSSPELLVRVHGSHVEYRPIAGTRPRGATEHGDKKNEESLRADPKEVAEHVMLVDLGRNDLGRVSEFGSVKVKDLMFIERYSHVMHLVSALEGTLKPALAPIDALRACFPAGTLSGAPKIRAMEIIEELEPARRGVYGGAIIYADFSGNLDSCIAIRTLFMDGENGHIQAGAGIVADSVPEREHEECRNKAAAVVRAIERARST